MVIPFGTASVATQGGRHDGQEHMCHSECAGIGLGVGVLTWSWGLDCGGGALAWGAGHDTHSAEHLAGAEH